jgi:hypothetical protein
MITVPSLSISLVVNVRVNGSEMPALTMVGLTDSVPAASASASPGNATRAKDTPTTRPRPRSGDLTTMVPARATGKPTHTTAAAIHGPASARHQHRRSAGPPEHPPGPGHVAGFIADHMADTVSERAPWQAGKT